MPKISISSWERSHIPYQPALFKSMIFPFGVICIRFLEGYFLENPPFSIGNRSGVYTLSPLEVDNGCISNMILSFSLRVMFQLPHFPTVSPSHSTTSTFYQMVFVFFGIFGRNLYTIQICSQTMWNLFQPPQNGWTSMASSKANLLLCSRFSRISPI